MLVAYLNTPIGIRWVMWSISFWLSLLPEKFLLLSLGWECVFPWLVCLSFGAQHNVFICAYVTILFYMCTFLIRVLQFWEAVLHIYSCIYELCCMFSNLVYCLCLGMLHCVFILACVIIWWIHIGCVYMVYPYRVCLYGVSTYGVFIWCIHIGLCWETSLQCLCNNLFIHVCIVCNKCACWVLCYFIILSSCAVPIRADGHGLPSDTRKKD